MIYFFCPSFLNINSQPFQTSQESLESLGPNKNDETSIEQRIIFSPTILLCSSSQEQLPPTMEMLPKARNQKLFVADKNQSKDGDYSPENQGSKRKRKSKQLQNRNVVPNIVRLILSFVQKKGKSEKLVQLLLKQHHCVYATLQRFFNFHKLIKNSMNNYVHQETLAQLVHVYSEHISVYSIEEQLCYNQITRKLIFHFLRTEADLCVVTSKRMDRIKKRDHLSSIRMLTNRLKSILIK